jgi:hypothetical protein
LISELLRLVYGDYQEGCEKGTTLQDRTTGQSLCLTEEEAMGLLDIVMMCPLELSAEQRAAMVKVSDFCRQFLREEGPSTPTLIRSALAELI